MTEKYKIYLSEETRSRLINDAELFEFTKQDESVNLNAFLKELIVNYFDQYRRDSESLRSSIIEDLTSSANISGKAAAALADKIVSTYINNDRAQSTRNPAMALAPSKELARATKPSKNTALTLTVSGASLETLRIIEANMLKDISLSQYLKDMFNAYLSIPRSEREAIIFKDTYEDIDRALKTHSVLTFTNTTAEEKHFFAVEPYIVAPSKEEQCNYLLCVDRKSRKARTFRISRLRSVFVTDRAFTVDPDMQKELQDKAIRSPQSVAKSVKAKIRLNEYGIKKFKMITKNRPQVSKIEGNFYYFDWPEMQLEDYFRRFGRDAIVIKPLSLKESLRKYYYYALREYNK
ncbi:WYL domain-containing protein [Butyrivibrio proteoclasticus]|uniref:WYL domain-containing protein n=1 Tax=Butyrivibrio proteoclasticus TaxID=43305 RepID=UPI00047ADE8D|nr:WYL domain-containing protein [Butyrivibrio proteoclasticus]